MEGIISFLPVWHRLQLLMHIRQTLNILLKRDLPTTLDTLAPVPPADTLDAELKAFADTLSPERFSRVAWQAPEGLYLFEGEVFLPYADAQAYRQKAIWIGAPFSRDDRTMEVLERLLPPPTQARQYRHPAAELLGGYRSYLILTYVPRDPGAWAWLLVLALDRVEEILDEALAGWLREKEASRAFFEFFQPWEVMRQAHSLDTFLHARRLMALDEGRFWEEWGRYPGALFLTLDYSPMDWDHYREILRAGFALLQAQGWREKEVRWLLAYPELTHKRVFDFLAVELREAEKSQELLRRALRLLLDSGVILKPERGVELTYQRQALSTLLELLAEHPSLSPDQSKAVAKVLRAWGRARQDPDDLLPILLRRAVEKPGSLSSAKGLGLKALAEHALGRPRPLFPGPFAQGGLVAVELLSPEALEEEGRAMGHCLRGKSWTLVLLGEERFFSIRDGEGRQVATLRLGWDGEAWQVTELRGPKNARVTEEVNTFAEEVAEAANRACIAAQPVA